MEINVIGGALYTQFAIVHGPIGYERDLGERSRDGTGYYMRYGNRNAYN